MRKFSRSFLRIDKLLKSIFTGKEDKIDKKSAFNKEFGVEQNEVLEGSKLAEILGIEYGGILNNTNLKVAGKGYYDTANKKIYKCTSNTSINYADSAYFIEVSNKDLLGKLQNLSIISYSKSETNGYIKYADGRLESWGVTPWIKTATMSTTYLINFPFVFSDKPNVSVNTEGLYQNTSRSDNFLEFRAGTTGVSTNSMLLAYSNRLYGTGEDDMRISWRAIGFWK